MRVLIVEDDEPLRQAVASAARTWSVQLGEGEAARSVPFSEVVQAGSLSDGLSRVEAEFDLLIVDVRLGDESGLKLVERAVALERPPVVLAISGQATANEGFHLASLGVRGYLGKPFDMRELRAAIQGVFLDPTPLEQNAMAQVGQRHIHTVQDEVKKAMLRRALQLDGGNITRAARRLGVTRTAVQQMLDRYGIPRGFGTDDNE